MGSSLGWLTASNRCTERIQTKLYLDDQPDYDRYLATCRARLDEEAFEAAWKEGADMGSDEALDYAQEIYEEVSHA